MSSITLQLTPENYLKRMNKIRPTSWLIMFGRSFARRTVPNECRERREMKRARTFKTFLKHTLLKNEMLSYSLQEYVKFKFCTFLNQKLDVFLWKTMIFLEILIQEWEFEFVSIWSMSKNSATNSWNFVTIHKV